jgi:hypothetical protein
MSYRYTQKEVMLNFMKGEAAHLGPTKSVRVSRYLWKSTKTALITLDSHKNLGEI